MSPPSTWSLSGRFGVALPPEDSPAPLARPLAYWCRPETMSHVTSPGLTRQSLRTLLGPVDEPGPLRPRVEEEVACEGYVRRHVSYEVPSGRASAFVCIPDDLSRPAPVVFCHHQHANEF